MTEREYIQTMCLVSILYYTRISFRYRFGRKFVVGRHHELICGILDKVYTGEIKRLLIRIAPRYSKTEIAVKSFISKGLALNPKSKYIHLSYSGELAIDNSSEVKDIIEEEFYQELFPYVRLKNDTRAKHKWYTTEGGGVYATSTAGQVTGFGAGLVDEESEDPEENECKTTDEKEINELRNEIQQIEANYESDITKFGGAIIIDDPIKPEDAKSDTKRSLINRRFYSTINNRTNSRNTPIIIIGQATHEEDLIGYVMKQEPGVWTLLSLPCIYVEDGEEKALFPFKHTLKELYALRESDKEVFETQYMQNPTPAEGLIFPIDSLHFADMDKVDFSEAAWSFSVGDPADKGGDFYSMPFCFVFCNENNLSVYVRSVIFNKNGIEANTERIKDRLQDHMIEKVFLESNGGWIAGALYLKKQIKNMTEVVAYSVSTNKMVRILSHYEFVCKHFVFDSQYKSDPDYRDFMHNLTHLLKEGQNKNDDSGDSICAAAEIVKIKFKKFLYG